MVAFSPLFSPGFEWEYPMITVGKEQQALDDDLVFMNSMFIPHHHPPSSDQAHQDGDDHVHDHDHHGESPPQSASSAHHHDDHDLGVANLLAKKKLNHNATERDRRKKINGLYTSLRALLPASYQTKRLSIPATITQVLKYIPELQKEVEDLIHIKEELLSKTSLLQGAGDFVEKPRKKIFNKSLYSISANKLGDREIAIQISTLVRISLAEVLVLLEKHGLLVIDVSCFQPFGGRIFYNIHLWMEETTTIDYKILNEEMISSFQPLKQLYF